MTKTLSIGVLGALCAVSALGCKNLFPAAEIPDRSYFAMQYKARAETEPRTLFEVKQADKFPSLRSTWNNAAISAPEHCSQESANKGTGAGEGGNVKLMTSCGFWLSELERGLVQSKFTVAQWSALRDLQRTKAVPAYVAARDLGADVVFVVNSLEAETVPLGSSAQETYDVFEADADGHGSRHLQLSKTEFDTARTFVRARMKPLRKEFAKVPTHITATLDITAVDTKTGEAVWFYRKQEVKPVSTRLERFFLFARESGETWPVFPHGIATAEAEEERAARSSESSVDRETYWREFKAPAKDSFAEASQALSRSVVADFLTRFRGG